MEQLKQKLIIVENLICPVCKQPHTDDDEWALNAHQTHLCQHCNTLFEGTMKAVSNPTFVRVNQPGNITYVPRPQI